MSPANQRGPQPPLPVLEIGDTRNEVAPALRWFMRSLIGVAKHLTEDPDLQDDLLQEAMIRLWQLDPTRFRMERPGDREYLWKAMQHRMINVYESELLRLGGVPVKPRRRQRPFYYLGRATSRLP